MAHAALLVYERPLEARSFGAGALASAGDPSGAAPVGLGFVGIKLAGADCVVNGVLWP